MIKSQRAGIEGSLSRDDWIRAAGQAIAERGVGAVAVEPLAKRLGVTKGSFYWHFPNRDALLTATLERWELENTESVISALGEISDPRRRLEQLISVAFTGEPTPDGTIPAEFAFGNAFDLAVADAADDPNVQPIFRRVSERRVDYIVDCYRALGCPPDEARYRGLLGYAAYVGSLRLAREAPSRVPRDDEYDAYQKLVFAAIVPGNTCAISGEDDQQPPTSGSRDAFD